LEDTTPPTIDSTQTTPPVINPSTPVVGLVNTIEPPKSRKKPKALLMGVILAVVLLFVGSAGAYYGLIVPNSPENVWEAALINTGEAYDEVAAFVITNEVAKGFNIDGNFDYKYDDARLSGDFMVKSYGSEFTVDINLKQEEFAATFNVLSVAKEESLVPDVYIRLEKLENLASISDSFTAEVYKDYVGNWYSLSDLDEGVLETTTDTEFSQQDYQELADAVGSVMKDFVFTSDEQKAVLELVEVVGSETFYDQDTYHYKVKLVPANFALFQAALETKLQETKIGQALNGELDAESYSETLTSNFEEGQTYDVWVNKKTKLLQTIRDYNDDAASYADIGQLYEGGDVIPVFLNLVNKNNDSTSETFLKLSLNRADSSARLEARYGGDGRGDDFTLMSNFKPNDQPLNITAPENAQSILSVLFGNSYQDESSFSDDILGLRTGMAVIDPNKVEDLASNIQRLVDQLLALPVSD